MTRSALSLLAAGVCALTALPTTAHARAQFDPNAHSMRVPGGALKTIGFETGGELIGAELVAWQGRRGYPTLIRTPITKGEDVLARLTSGPADAIEGEHALRLGGAPGEPPKGLAIVDPALFERVKGGRFEVSLWARADGAAPQLHVVYDKDPANVYGGRGEFATVRGVRTGRATTDGWAEYVAGPLDGSVWGVPARGIVVVASPYAEDGESFLIDALEVREVEGEPTEPRACTQQTVDAVCGAEGDCMFGHCVSSTVTWGPLPPLAHRREIAERWIFYATRVIGDRNAAKRGVEILTPAARALAERAVSSRQFFGGMNRLVNLLRDNHTSFGSPSNLTNFAPQIFSASSSVLGACFGVVDKDLLGGGLGYAVFRSIDEPISGVALERGDVLFSIDGQDPKTWVDEQWPRYATAMPNDPASDWAPSANDLSRLITTRASKVTLLRCASSSACDADSRQTITVDVASAVYAALTSDEEVPNTSFRCTQRFTETAPPPPDAEYTGEDPVYTKVGPGGETRVQFDGFVGQSSWQASMSDVFSGHPERVMMDARMGHGGYYNAVQDLFDLVRGTSEPFGVVSLGRGTYDLEDPPWLFSRLGQCTTPDGDQWSCFEGNAVGFFASKADPPGASTKIAWLNSYDVSANDFMPRLLQGRTKFRIFGPHPTSGAFGSISELPPLYTSWSGGSMQMQDTRFGVDLEEASSARWESGHGVIPDEVVAEKLSDAIDGEDTIVTAAAAWLAAP